MINSSYSELENRGKFRAYVVNVYDPVNYDIDIHFDENTKKIYDNIFKSYYTSLSLDSEKLEDRLPQQRASYRCRIKGISMDRTGNKELLVKQATNVINKKIFLFNGWVDCYVSDIDFYNRILVELFDPLTGESLTHELFNTPKYSDIFSTYIRCLS